MAIVGHINTALSHLGHGRTISRIDEPSAEANAGNTFYDIAFWDTLSSHDWGFASKHVYAALKETDYYGWYFAYVYPNDALVIRELSCDPRKTAYHTGFNTQTVPMHNANDFMRSLHADGETQLMLCNIENAMLRYTAKVNPAIAPHYFIMAFCYNLAIHMSAEIRNTSGSDLNNMYEKKLSVAMQFDCNEYRMSMRTRTLQAIIARNGYNQDYPYYASTNSD